ncbi:uncharacterized protein [Watersipora subatra]|uniref:uncharacterized protein n=1 Tax=Watersipora subatra TaxID=2589382 RepID=UPI00355C7AB0
MSDESVPTVKYPYLKNMVGFKVDEESMKAVPHAKAELYVHVTTKFAQAFAIIGCMAGAGLGAVRPGKCPVKGFLNGGRNGMLLGLPAGVLATYARMAQVKGSDQDVDMEYAFYDRSYRLRHNRTQVRVDTTSYIGLSAGVLAGAVSSAAYGPLQLGATGLVAGTLAASVYNYATATSD